MSFSDQNSIINELIGIGFDKFWVEKALQLSKGHKNLAIEWLLSDELGYLNSGWKCYSCESKVPSTKNICTYCNAKKPSKDVWICESCTFANNIINIQCQICYQKKPDNNNIGNNNNNNNNNNKIDKIPNWECPECNKSNHHKTHKCLDCGYDRTSTVPPTPFQLSPKEEKDPIYCNIVTNDKINETNNGYTPGNYIDNNVYINDDKSTLINNANDILRFTFNTINTNKQEINNENNGNNSDIKNKNNNSSSIKNINKKILSNNKPTLCGYLWKQSRFLKVWRKRWCILTKNGHIHTFKIKIQTKDYKKNAELIQNNLTETIDLKLRDSSNNVYKILYYNSDPNLFTLISDDNKFKFKIYHFDEQNNINNNNNKNNNNIDTIIIKKQRDEWISKMTQHLKIYSRKKN